MFISVASRVSFTGYDFVFLLPFGLRIDHGEPKDDVGEFSVAVVLCFATCRVRTETARMTELFSLPTPVELRANISYYWVTRFLEGPRNGDVGIVGF